MVGIFALFGHILEPCLQNFMLGESNLYFSVYIMNYLDRVSMSGLAIAAISN
jgi:hypothetical protein